MIQGSGQRPDGAPMLLLGVTHDEVVRMLAGEPIVVETEHANPLLPPMRIALVGGASNEALTAALQARWPGLWEVPTMPEGPR